MNTVINETIIGVLAKIADNPMRFFRTVTTFCVNPDKGLYGPAWYAVYEAASTEPVKFPINQIFIEKFVFIKNEQWNCNSFILTNGPVNHAIPAGITATLNPGKIDLPKDGHIRWQANYPSINTGKIGYLTHASDTLVLNPATLKGMNPDDMANDIQIAYTPVWRKYTMHILTKKRGVYAGTITDEDIRRGNRPEITKVESGANALLTIPRDNEVIPILGTDNGIAIAGTYLDTTKGQKVTNMIIGAESNMIIYETGNKIFAMRFDDNLRTIAAPMLVSDSHGPFTRMMSGKALEEGNRKNIILTNCQPGPNGKTYIFTYQVIGFQPTT